jgi:hypothetical protein
VEVGFWTCKSHVSGLVGGFRHHAWVGTLDRTNSCGRDGSSVPLIPFEGFPGCEPLQLGMIFSGMWLSSNAEEPLRRSLRMSIELGDLEGQATSLAQRWRLFLNHFL